jgi:D-alanine-D-alanine ligase
LFIKPVSEGTGKGINDRSIVKNEDEYRSLCIELLDKFNQPVLAEEYLPGREFTAGVIGNGKSARVIGAMEVCFVEGILPIYSYNTKENWIGRVKYEIVEGELLTECSNVALGAWNALGAQDGGRVDMKIGSNGCVQFIEANPLAGINAEISDLPILARMNGITYQELIEEIMNAAILRIFKKPWGRK